MYYRIADLTVKIDFLGITMERAEKYRIDPVENPDIDIPVEDIKNQVYDFIAKYPMLQGSWIEHNSTLLCFCRQLIRFNGMRLHSSAVVVDGKAYLFSADPGTGKSTHTKLWLKQFGDKAYILNDDKPIIRFVDGTFYAYGSPWSGKDDLSVNKGVPIAGITMLERGKKNEIDRFFGVEALAALMRQLPRPRKLEYRSKVLKLLDKLINDVPIWKLKCNMDPEAAIVSYEAMSGQKFEKEI